MWRLASWSPRDLANPEQGVVSALYARIRHEHGVELWKRMSRLHLVSAISRIDGMHRQRDRIDRCIRIDFAADSKRELR